MSIHIPESVAARLGEQAEEKIRLWAAVKGYELKELTAGAAAELAGMSKLRFLQGLGAFGISVFDITPEQLEEEVRVAMEAAGRTPKKI